MQIDFNFKNTVRHEILVTQKINSNYNPIGIAYTNSEYKLPLSNPQLISLRSDNVLYHFYQMHRFY